MKAMWWYNDSIAGMARPGLNAIHWYDLAFDEGIFFSWIGKHPEGTYDLGSFQEHLETYAPRIFPFYKMDDAAGKKALEVFETGKAEILDRLVHRTKAIKNVSLSEKSLTFSYCDERLAWEMNELKRMGISTVVTLTEHHHQKDALDRHFDLHHFSIEDLNAPSHDQARELAKIISSSNGKIAVHCLAGIGRTSTMIMAAHIAMGESPESVEKQIARQNPFFKLTGPQREFIREFSGD